MYRTQDLHGAVIGGSNFKSAGTFDAIAEKIKKVSVVL